MKTSGKYEYRWRERIGQDDDGKTIYKQRSITAKTLDELREMEKQITKDRADGLHPRQATTLDDYVDKWLTIKRGLKDNTRSNYIYFYNKYIRGTYIGTMPLYKLKKSDLMTFYSGLVDKKQLSISACVILQNVVHPALELAFEDDAIRKNPASGALTGLRREDKIQKAEAKAKGEHRPQSLTLAEQKRFFEVINGTPWEPVFTIASLTGLRCGELTCVTEDAIDEKEGVIHITKTLVYYKKADGKCGLEVHSVKTAAGIRDIPLNDKIKEELRKQREQTPPEFSAVSIDGVKGFVFMTKEGRPHRQDTLNRALRRIVRKANDEQEEGGTLLPSIHMHLLRKTFATNAIRAGVQIEPLAKLMGHSSIEVTHGIYIAARRDLLADADAAMVKALKNAGIIDPDIFADEQNGEQNDTQN